MTTAFRLILAIPQLIVLALLTSNEEHRSVRVARWTWLAFGADLRARPKTAHRGTARQWATMWAVDPDQVLYILDRLASEHITAWIDGGWGVDALLGHQTREHCDLDLVVDADAVHRVRGLLVEEGFEVVRDWQPTAIAFAHADGREVDLHPVELTTDGGATRFSSTALGVGTTTRR